MRFAKLKLIIWRVWLIICQYCEFAQAKLIKTMQNIFTPDTKNLIPIVLVGTNGLAGNFSPNILNWAIANDFNAKGGSILLCANENGELEKVLLGVGDKLLPKYFGNLSKQLPKGDYKIATIIDTGLAQDCLLQFALGAYEYCEFKKPNSKEVRLSIPENCDGKRLEITARAIFMGRDLINAPASLLGPDSLEARAKEIANVHKAEFISIIGEELLAQNFPLIYAVGKAGHQNPRICKITKPKANAPKVAIVGKGITFDTGGINLKPSNGIGLMKKDMGGAACALTAFDILAQLDLNIDLSVYIPIAENAVSSNAMRPSDVYISRAGLSVEIDNTDAEGRLILADAIAYACEDKPDIVIDFATLTGAARVALGPDLPPLYCNDEMFLGEILAASELVEDPLWHMPLWDNYNEYNESKIADIKNSGSAFAGSITAALFLQNFVKPEIKWAHIDVYCHNPKASAGRPFGGEIQAVRAVGAALEAMFG